MLLRPLLLLLLLLLLVLLLPRPYTTTTTTPAGSANTSGFCEWQLKRLQCQDFEQPPIFADFTCLILHVFAPHFAVSWTGA